MVRPLRELRELRELRDRAEEGLPLMEDAIRFTAQVALLAFVMAIAALVMAGKK